MAVANAYANLELRIPKNEWESVRRFTSTFKSEDRSSTDIDHSPFDRYVDLWWAALTIGIRQGTRARPSEWHTFVTGVVLNQDSWRIRQLELLALAEAGTPEVLDDPGRVIAIANEYAATGVAVLIDEMTGMTEPIWGVTSLFRRFVDQETVGVS